MLPPPLKLLYKAPLVPCSSKKKGKQIGRETPRLKARAVFFSVSSKNTNDVQTRTKENRARGSRSTETHTLTQNAQVAHVRAPVHGSPRPAVGRHGGRAAAGLRPRQAPQVRLLLPLLHRLGVRGRGFGCGGGRRRADRDAEHHHAAPAGAVRDVAAQRVQLSAVVPGQRHPGLALRHSDDAQRRGLEEAAPERQDDRRRRRGCTRHAEKPYRLRLGGDQFAGPVK